MGVEKGRRERTEAGFPGLLPVRRHPSVLMMQHALVWATVAWVPTGWWAWHPGWLLVFGRMVFAVSEHSLLE